MKFYSTIIFLALISTFFPFKSAEKSFRTRYFSLNGSDMAQKSFIGGGPDPIFSEFPFCKGVLFVQIQFSKEKWASVLMPWHDKNILTSGLAQVSKETGHKPYEVRGYFLRGEKRYRKIEPSLKVLDSIIAYPREALTS